MKNPAPIVGFLMILIAFTSCKSDQQKKAEIVTNNYVRFIDSVTNKGTIDAVNNWKKIAKDFDKKSSELNIEIDKLEDVKIFDKRINPATEKYEAFRNLIHENNTEQKAEELEIYSSK